MRLVLAAVLAFTALSASAQTEPTRPLPRWHRSVRGDFAPPQTSAARAFLYSAAATGALVGVGTVVILATANTDTEAGGIAGGVGSAVVLTGLLYGPAAGNLSLGAGAAVDRTMRWKMRALGAGTALAGAGLVVALGCVLGHFDGGDCPAGDAALVLIAAGGGVAATGIVVGGVVDLVTIPANARWAQRVRASGNRVPVEAPRVSVAPGYDLRHEAPMLTLRVGI